MNNVSWLIYLGSVSGSVSGFFTLCAVLAGVVCVIGTVMWCMTSDFDHSQGWMDKANERGRWFLRRAVPSFMLFGLAACFLPSSNTVYAIAASEVAGRVASSEAVSDISKEALASLKEWLRQQREPKAEKK